MVKFFTIFLGAKEGLSRIELRNNVWETKKISLFWSRQAHAITVGKREEQGAMLGALSE